MNLKRFFAVVLLAAAWTHAGLAPVARGDETVERLAPAALGKFQVAVDFRYATAQHNVLDPYFVTVTIRKRANAPAIKAEQLEVWVLQKSGVGTTLSLKKRPPKGDLPEEVKGQEATAKAVFSFTFEVYREDLVAVVVALDGEPILFKLPRPAK